MLKKRNYDNNLPDLQITTIEIENDLAYVTCPNCKEFEQIHVDQQRHHLRQFPILEWFEDFRNTVEASVHKCQLCNTEFVVEWDYENKVKAN